MLSRRVETLPEDSLAWIWAYSEQLKLLDAHDAFWIEKSEVGWSQHDLRQFIRAYGVGRGTSGKYLYENVQAIGDRLHQEFFEVGSSVSELSRAWLGAVSQLKEASNGCTTASFCSKLLWFYRPETMFMYDRNVISALRSLISNGIDISRYLEEMEAQFQLQAPNIEMAAAHFERLYPYKRRVLDKWLWLLGSQQRSERLLKFRKAMILAPWPL